SNGAVLWESRGPHGYVRAAALDSSGNVVVAGSSSGDYCTAKYAGGATARCSGSGAIMAPRIKATSCVMLPSDRTV
ncbi:MAG TPA: hypothetical protein VFB63_07475, partial [Bryobacteraceae bacterium]|nr:hypothetical protein [Bryobacteraceae bacterium]